MNVSNNYKFVIPTGEKYINLPIEIKWDFNGRQDDIEKYQEKVLDDILGTKTSYEIARYTHNPYGQNGLTAIKYDFWFYNSPNSVTASTSNTDWVNSYIFNSAIPSGFTPSEVYYFKKVFTKSFFKLDFYDTPNTVTQKNYLTIILPVQQGGTEQKSISPLLPLVDIKKPSMNLDFVGDKEGFFIYWLRSKDYLDIDTFYMTAKFFDAREGVFVRMMNEPQSSLPDKFLFDTERYFYYKLKIDYDTQKYEVLNYQNVRIGNGTSINWYEYVNP